MKIFLLLLLISFNCYSQQADTSVNARINLMEKNLYKMSENLKSAHGQYRWGTKGLLVGSSLIAYGAASTAPLETKQAFCVMGGFIDLLSAMIMIDSHKFIGRAGRFEYDFNKMQMSFDLTKK